MVRHILADVGLEYMMHKIVECSLVAYNKDK